VETLSNVPPKSIEIDRSITDITRLDLADCQCLHRSDPSHFKLRQ
jgi:hypothetical protein